MCQCILPILKIDIYIFYIYTYIFYLIILHIFSTRSLYWYSRSIITVHTVAQLPVGTFDVSVGQNGMRMREISKLPSVAMVTT